MAHYLEFHSLDKKFTQGVKVLSFTDFNEPMEKIFGAPRASFLNDVFRKHFAALSDDWDVDYFVLRESDPHYIIAELEKLYREYDNQEDIELIGSVICKLEEIWKDIGSETKGYVVSWSK